MLVDQAMWLSGWQGRLGRGSLPCEESEHTPPRDPSGVHITCVLLAGSGDDRIAPREVVTARSIVFQNLFGGRDSREGII